MEITASQAARKYGVFPHVLYRMILMGRIQARKDEDGRWRITTESLERWNQQRVRRVPRPKPQEAAVRESSFMRRRRQEQAEIMPLFSEVRRADRLSMLSAQIKLLKRQFEGNLPLTSGALARAERVARSLELDEVAP
jgi:hypothetical protein